ncbi:hypothetical protein [Brevibacillus massiliensis]|uniref:hypothetical protein n=1 Tax=Brevibacillus massiliensis TaxID=1118054 RepID=UPI00037444FB|nr:hypothetical protein [Brevibacillus massiliensis]
MFKIRLIKNLRTASVHISKGTVMVARVRPGSFLELNRPYQVIEGPHSGLEVPAEYAVVLPAERMYSEAEYNKLRNELNVIRAENKRIQEEINKMAAGEKVSLPREVAEAIEECKNAWNPFGDDIYLHFLNIDGFDDRTTSGRILASYARSKPFEYMSALVNGYTVEQSPAERLKQGIQQIYEQWTHTPSTGDDQADGADLAERIIKYLEAEKKL